MADRGSDTGRWLALIGAGLLALLTIVGIWKLGTWIGFFLVYQWLFDLITGHGVNVHVSRAVAVVMGAAIWYSALHCLRTNRKMAVVLLVSLVVVQSGFLFFADRNRYFAPRDGRALRYYTVHPVTKELQFFDRPIYDRLGQKAQVVTPDVARRAESRRLYRPDTNDEVAPGRIKRYFDQRTGAPVIWYSCDSEGNTHFYRHDGFDPLTGEKLRPITREAVEQRGGQPMGTTSAGGSPASTPAANRVSPASDDFKNATLIQRVDGDVREVSAIDVTYWSSYRLWRVGTWVSDGVTYASGVCNPAIEWPLDLGSYRQVRVTLNRPFIAWSNRRLKVRLYLSRGGTDRRQVEYDFEPARPQR